MEAIIYIYIVVDLSEFGRLFQSDSINHLS